MKKIISIPVSRVRSDALCPWCVRTLENKGSYSTGDYERHVYSCKRCKTIIEVLR